MANWIGHFKTITKHRHQVIRHCFKAGIGLQGLRHDLSKYTPVEFLNGVKYYDGKRSPNELEREDKGYSSAWLHHKGRNRHHFEYWMDYVPGQPGLSPVPMPPAYLVEMVCDRIAASKTYLGSSYKNDSPLCYYLSRRDRIRMHADTAHQLEAFLQLLATSGEDALFSSMRAFLYKH